MNLDEITKFVASLERSLEKLPYSNQLTFAASCCERAYPNYERFSQEEHWGNSAVLRSALDKVWKFLLGAGPTPNDCTVLVESLRAATPDSDMFHPKTPAESILITAGQEAAFMVTLLLEFCMDRDSRHVIQILDFAQETVRRYVQAAEGMDPNDRDLERKIAQHPLMLRELEKESCDLEALMKAKTIGDLNEFRRQAIPEFSNIGVQSCHPRPLQS